MDLPGLNDRPPQPWIIWGLLVPFLADPKAFPQILMEPSVVRSNLAGRSFVKEKCPEGHVVPTPLGGLFLNKTFVAHRNCSQNSRAGEGFASGVPEPRGWVCTPTRGLRNGQPGISQQSLKGDSHSPAGLLEKHRLSGVQPKSSAPLCMCAALLWRNGWFETECQKTIEMWTMQSPLLLTLQSPREVALP